MDEDTPLLIFHELRRISVELELSRARFAETKGLHGTDVRALICLLDAERGGNAATPGWLGSQLGMNSAGTTALIDRLEKVGLVARVRDLGDRRQIRLGVTASAKAAGWEFFGPLIHEVTSELQQLSLREQTTVLHAVAAAAAAVSRHRIQRVS